MTDIDVEGLRAWAATRALGQGRNAERYRQVVQLLDERASLYRVERLDDGTILVFSDDHPHSFMATSIVTDLRERVAELEKREVNLEGHSFGCEASYNLSADCTCGKGRGA